jgi:hypothetical protein
MEHPGIFVRGRGELFSDGGSLTALALPGLALFEGEGRLYSMEKENLCSPHFVLSGMRRAAIV